jgi:cytochrome c556
MSKFVKAAIAAACIIAAGTANAQLGGLGSMLGGAKSASSVTDISADVTAFVTQTNALSQLTGNSVIAINAAFVSDTERAKIRAEMDVINKIADPKEREAKFAALVESKKAETQRLMDSGEMKAQMDKFGSEKKKAIGDALMNFGIGALQAAALTQTGQSLVQKSAANPMNLTKVVPVKDALPLLGKVVTDSGGFIAGVAKVAKGANINVAPVTVKSKPAEVSVF